MRGNFHAPFWSSGRQSDLPTDCTGTRPVLGYPAGCHKEGSQVRLVKNLPLKGALEGAIYPPQRMDVGLTGFGAEELVQMRHNRHG